MRVAEQPKRLIDSDGEPITEFEPGGSRYETIAIKESEGELLVRASDQISEETVEFSVSLRSEMYRGVTVEDADRRRDVPDDILDALHLVGFTAVDLNTKQYDG